jgi:hypothetical protein
MESKEMSQQINAQIQTLIEKGYLNSKGSTSSDDFRQQFQMAVNEVLENPNPRLHKMPVQERFEWLDVECRMPFGPEKVLFNFRFTFFPERRSLELGELEVSLPGKPAVAFLAAGDHLFSPEKAYEMAGGSELHIRRPPIKQKQVDPPHNRKRPNPGKRK